MKENIGEGLIRIGAMKREQVETVLTRQRSGDKRLFGEIAIELGYVDDLAIKKYLKLKTCCCTYSHSCHFYDISKPTFGNQRLKELYCEEWPEKCAIFQQKKAGKPVSITLWPTGNLKGMPALQK